MDKGLRKIETAFKKEMEAGKKRRIKSLLNKETHHDFDFPPLPLDREGSVDAAQNMTFEDFLSKVLVIGNDHGINA